MAEVKFCGMTRPEDVAEAGRLGAAWVGTIFAESPRRLTAAKAAAVLGGAPSGVGRVGVFGAASVEDIVATAREARLDVVQLHGDPSPSFVEDLRREWKGGAWAVVRVTGAELPESALRLFDVADAVVLDARVDGALGGSGVALDWTALRARLEGRAGWKARLVVAGGLTPDNVARAIDALHPDVVDVSSGVESSVGIKDHARMRAFRDAAVGTAR